MAAAATVALTVEDAAELERTVAAYTAQGYAVVRHGHSDALLLRHRDPRWWTVVLTTLVGGWGATGTSEYIDVRVGATAQEAFHPVFEDGNWWWNGKRWDSTARVRPPDAQQSLDGLTWWTGREWRPLPHPVSGWHSPDYTPGKIPSLGDPRSRVIRSDHFSLLVGLIAAVVLIGLGVLGLESALPVLAIGGFLFAFLLLARGLTSPPTITIDASGIHAKSRRRQYSVPWSMTANIKADSSGALVCFDTSGQPWPWHVGKVSDGIGLVQAKWFRWDGDYLAAAIDEMSQRLRLGA
jgi:hypothetical protein